MLNSVKITAFLLSFCLLLTPALRMPLRAAMLAASVAPFEEEIPVDTAPATVPFDVDAASAVLMEASTGLILYEKNPDQALPPASVTKIMTLLLVMEALDAGTLTMEEPVPVSEYAASMGGSQVYLKVGEVITARDLLKSVIIASANDAAVALAERVAGSTELFVAKMNQRAGELGMKSTHFENPTGLDDAVTHHVTSARDIAIMSRELMTHEEIFPFTTTWMDSIRDGAFGLTNTNRLIRFYPGANGLKTGSTAKAKFCISAAAKREDMQLIAVIMGSPTRDIRNAEAKKLLDFGFATYCAVKWEGQSGIQIPVVGGKSASAEACYSGYCCIAPKGSEVEREPVLELPSSLDAPVKEGDVIGSARFRIGGETVGEVPILAAVSVPRLGFRDLILRLLRLAAV